MENLQGDNYVERLVMTADIERLDGAVEHDASVYRQEQLLDADDLDSTICVEYEAVTASGEEIYLGSDKGDNLIIKEREY